MGELGALFNPGMRHEIEERKSKEMRREEEGDSDPGDLRIDLFSGVAVIALGKNGPISATGADPQHGSASTDDSDTSADPDTSAETTSTTESAQDENRD